MSASWQHWEGHSINGEFPLIRFLGGAERSAVFETRFPPNSDQKAAIKLVRAEPETLERLRLQWESAAKLSHPHLVRMFQAGLSKLDGAELLYVVMEHADEVLAEVLGDRPLAPEEAAQMLAPAIEALGYLHGEGFIHGHLKPSNIVSVNEQLKISSDSARRFGSPALADGDDPFNAPENAGGEVSAAADVWSLGVTMVETLTQQLPAFDPKAAAEPLLPRPLPDPFQEIARNCLRREPGRRWTLQQIKVGLNPAAAPVAPTPPIAIPPPIASPPPIAARPPAAAPLEAQPERSYAKPLLGAIAAIAVILLAISAFNRPDSPNAETQPAQQIAAAPEPAAEPEPAPTEPPQAEPPPVAKARPSPIPEPAPEPPRAQPDPPRVQPAPPTAARESSHAGIVREVLPEPPAKSLRTIQGSFEVVVRVSVDPQGRVTNAKFESQGPSRYFGQMALDSSRRWEFEPSGAAPSEWLLRYEFTRAGAEAFPRRL